MRAPESAGTAAPVVARPWWWSGQDSAAARLATPVLAPAELLFRLAAGVYHGAYDAGVLPVSRAAVPAVSVGNLTVGGTGKTPVAGWLVAELLRRGGRPAVLHGGYAQDEPALHRRWHPDVPVLVGRDRAASAHAAVERGASVLVLDDAFQHRRLARDVDIVLLAAEQCESRPHLLPRGPWREPLSALRRADVVAVTRKSADPQRAEKAAELARRFAPQATVVRILLRPGAWRRGDVAAAGPPRGPALAVAGIAHPELFVAGAREAGAEVAELFSFPDHHAYRPSDAERIRRRANGRHVVVTEKDWVKLAGLADLPAVWVLEQEVEIETGAAELGRLLDGVVR